MSLYGDLPPPTRSAPNADKEETQQSSVEAQSSPKTSKSALPAGWTPGTLRFMPTIQRKPVIQAKPKLNPKIQASSSQNATTPSASSNQASSSTSSSSIVASSSLQPFPSESGPIVPPTSVVTSSPKQPVVSDELNEHKPAAFNSQRNLRSSFEKGKKPIKGVKRQVPLSYEDEYDPTRPNDYEEFKEFEKRRRENEVYRLHEERVRSRSMSVDSDKHSPPRSFPPPPLLYSDSPPSSKASEVSADAPVVRSPPVKLDLDISGEEAFLRRARLSNRVNEITQKSPESKVTPPNSGEDFAHRMLAKYGWQEGQGLGKNEQGISEPLTVQKTVKGSGYIVNTSSNSIAKTDTKPIPKAEQVSKAVPNYEVPSRVIMLTNMVGPGEVDDTLQEETADECNEKYGAVERCLIFEVPHGKLPDDQAVRIFVKFVDQVAALKAKKDLNGRFFGGRAVSARFFDEARFDKLDLAPSPAEFQMV
ncbi:15368_t:CDS:2 [Acaulospora morrowiae]|uniref:15368_t:CDS:1 n=1 Tax=Acaulospora morrowiae TaxID=94023 RepID=A0A9N8VWG9_9GLOM|nr:15368_t:CDS:2 [Acaulospora morrowiae]